MKIRLLYFLPIFLLSCGALKQNPSKDVFKVQVYSVVSDSSFQVLSIPGRVKAAEDVLLSFKVSGKIDNVPVKEGDRVAKGTLLASIDPKDYNIQLSATEAQHQQITSEAERVMRLYKDSVVSENDYDKARFGVEQIKAKLDFARTQVADCKLYAPFNGWVQNIYYHPSSVVAAGVPVITFLSSGVPEIEIDVPSYVYLNRSRVRDCTATISTDLGEKTVNLALSSYSPKANANQLYTIRLSITSALKTYPNPGMISMVSLILESSTHKDQTAIPVGALFEYNGEDYIWIVASDSTVHRQAVDIKMIDTDGFAVVGGSLPAGTNVVSAGVHKLSEGQKVEILEPASKTNIGGIF